MRREIRLIKFHKLTNAEFSNATLPFFLNHFRKQIKLPLYIFENPICFRLIRSFLTATANRLDFVAFILSLIEGVR